MFKNYNTLFVVYKNKFVSHNYFRMKRKTRSRKNQLIEEDDSDNIDVNRNGVKSNTTSESICPFMLFNDLLYIEHISSNVTNFISIKDRPVIPKSIFLQSLDSSVKNV